MIDISLSGISELIAKLAGMPEAVDAALLAQSQALADALVKHVVDDKLSGEVLDDKTGLLKSSIESEVAAAPDGTTASVFVSGDVPYAAIQEYGGQTKAHIIEATKAKALSFMAGGKQAFFALVNHPGSNIPEHSYLRSALADMQDDIVSGMAEASDEALS